MNTKIRCIAIDLDDTLLQTNLAISRENKEAIWKAMNQGIKILLASGRMFQSMKPYAEELKLNLPLIAYNGALVQETYSGKILYHRPIPNEIAKQLVPIFRDAQLHLNVYVNDQLFMDELTDWGKMYAATAMVEPHPIGDVEEILSKHHPHKMLGLGEKIEIDQIQNFLQKEFGNVLDFVKSKPNYLEVLAPGVSKGDALRELTASWGLSSEEVMAIGNAPNDLAMIEWAGIGVAIGNADEIVKEKANLVVSEHNSHGVAEAIFHILK